MKDITISAGLFIKYNDKVLLVHPSDAPSWYGSFGLPKGKLENGEDKLDAAIRETYEETGMYIDKSDVNKREYVVRYKDKDGRTYKKVFYYIVELNKIDDLVLPKDQLQLSEIDWAEFMDKDEAQYRIFWRQENVLRHLN